jgi:uncharacterized protein involved in cysteine biosynthesis
LCSAGYDDVISALLLAFRQLPDPKIRTVLIQSVLAAIAVFALLTVAVVLLVGLLGLTGVGWVDWLMGVFSGIVSLTGAWLFFPVVVIALTSLFTDRVAAAVEARHYPALPTPRLIPLAEEVRGALALLGKGVLLNLAILPLYFLTGPIAPFLFYAANGYLLGRDYFQSIALRRLPLAQVQAVAGQQQKRIWGAGIVLAFLGTVPFINLLVPILATAFMIHLFERLRQRGAF